MAKTKEATPSEPTPDNPASNPPRPIGAIIDEMRAIHVKRTKLADAFKDKDEPLKEAYSNLEKALVSRLLHEEADGGKGKTASANLKRAMTFSVADRTALEAWIKKTGMFQVFTNHLSSASIAEILENKRIKEVPGVKSFEKITINLTALKGS